MVAVPAKFDIGSDLVVRRPSPTFITTGPSSLKPFYPSPVAPVRTPPPTVTAVDSGKSVQPKTGGADSFGMTPDGGAVSTPTQPPSTDSKMSGLIVAGVGAIAYFLIRRM